jgi:MFS family permease
MATMEIRLSEVSSAQKRTLLAAAMGWALDAFDVMLYSLVIAHVMTAFGLSKAGAGWLSTFTLFASGIGGVLFGYIADRVGRTKALMLSILTYSLCSLGSGLSTSIPMLAFFRFVLGLGMGGEWNTGATLVAETWPTHLRAKAIAIVQSSWAWGYAAAAIVAGFVLKATQNWRYVFFIGILPALVTLWIRKSVPESELWRQQKNAAKEQKAPFSEIFAPLLRKRTIFLFLLNFFGLFAWWGIVLMDPAVSCSSRGQRRTRLWPDADHNTFGDAQPGWYVSRLYHFWMGGRKIRTQESFYLLPSWRRGPGPDLCGSAFAVDHHGSGRDGRILRQRILLRVRPDRQRTVPYSRPLARTGLYL